MAFGPMAYAVRYSQEVIAWRFSLLSYLYKYVVAPGVTLCLLPWL